MLLESPAAMLSYKLHEITSIADELGEEVSKHGIDKTHINRLLHRVSQLLGEVSVLAKRYGEMLSSEAFWQSLSIAGQAQVEGKKASPEDFMKLFKLFLTPKIDTRDVESLKFKVDALLTLFTHASDRLGEKHNGRLFTGIRLCNTLIG